MDMTIHEAQVAAQCSDERHPATLFYGPSQYDLGPSYTDPRSGLLYTKHTNGSSFRYAVAQGTILNGVLGGEATDANATGTTDPSRLLYTMTVPGGSMIHKDKFTINFKFSSSANASGGTFTFKFSSNLYGSNLYTAYYNGDNTMAQNITMVLDPEDTNLLIFSGTAGLYPSGGGYTRPMNLLADWKVEVFFKWSGAPTGRTMSALATSKGTYTTISNATIQPGLTLADYRDPNVTPFGDDSFWNVKLSSTATYANPATDIETIWMRSEYPGRRPGDYSTKTNYRWISGQGGDGVPIYAYDAGYTTCRGRINAVSSGGMKVNGPFPFVVERTTNGYGLSETYFKLRMLPTAYASGQSTDRFLTIKSGDGRFAYEMGGYFFSSRRWQANKFYYANERLVPNDWAKKRYYYSSNVDATSGAVEPNWPTTIGGTVIDGGITWTCQRNADTAWPALTAVSQFRTVYPTVPNGFRYWAMATTPGTTGATEPTWPTTVGATVVDGGVTWTCRNYGKGNYEAMHTFSTLYVADLYGTGYSKKYYPWYTTNVVDSTLSGFQFQQFHRAGGLSSHAGMVAKSDLDRGFIDHMLNIGASYMMLACSRWTVVTATAGQPVVVIKGPKFTDYPYVDYTSKFTAGVVVALTSAIGTNGTPYTVASSFFNTVTGYTEVTLTTNIAASATYFCIGATGSLRSEQQLVWPNVTADSGAESAYSGISPMGTVFAIPPEVDVTTLGLSAEGVIVARAFQQFGGITCDTSVITFTVFQIKNDLTSAQKTALIADKATIINNLVRVTNWDRALVQAALTEAPLAIQKPIIPLYTPTLARWGAPWI